MFRKGIVSVFVALVLVVSGAGTALCQTGPIGHGSNPTQPNLNSNLKAAELQKLVEARDPNAKIIENKDRDGKLIMVCLFNQEVKGVQHRVLIVWSPSQNKVVIDVTVSEPISQKQALAVSAQLPTWNDQVAPHTIGVMNYDDNNHVLMFESVLKGSLSSERVETELTNLLDSVAKAQPLWANLR